MYIKVIKCEVQKVIECDGYNLQRYYHRKKPNGETAEILIPNGPEDQTPAGVETYMVIEPRYNQIGFSSPAFVIPEKGENAVYIMNNQGDTIDRFVWRR